MARELIIIDAEGRALGRVASEAAYALRGKTDPSFESNLVPDQKVIITNAGRIRITGKKLRESMRERYSGYPGGLKQIPYERDFKKDPREFMRRTITGMIPRNRLRKDILKNLTIYVADKN
jgi:large subunit ribosomal protein L13